MLCLYRPTSSSYTDKQQTQKERSTWALLITAISHHYHHKWLNATGCVPTTAGHKWSHIARAYCIEAKAAAICLHSWPVCASHCWAVSARDDPTGWGWTIDVWRGWGGSGTHGPTYSLARHQHNTTTKWYPSWHPPNWQIMMNATDQKDEMVLNSHLSGWRRKHNRLWPWLWVVMHEHGDRDPCGMLDHTPRWMIIVYDGM